MEKRHLNIILIGKTGSGKSATGNLILGKPVFKSQGGSASITKDVKAETTYVDGRQITVVDTPGLFDTNDDQLQTALKVQASLKTVSPGPGPNAFGIVINGNSRYTEDERRTQEMLLLTFGETLFKHGIIILTHEDDFDDACVLLSFAKREDHLNRLITKCGGRCITVDNKSRDPGYRQKKQKNFIDEVRTMSKEGAEYYQQDIEIYRKSLEECFKNGSKFTDLNIVQIESLLQKHAQLRNEELQKLNQVPKSSGNGAIKEAVQGVVAGLVTGVALAGACTIGTGLLITGMDSAAESVLESVRQFPERESISTTVNRMMRDKSFPYSSMTMPCLKSPNFSYK